jgi:hypothetical protein
MLPHFERHHATSYGAAAVSSKSMCRQTIAITGWRDIVAFILPSRAGEAIQSLLTA